MAKLSTILFNRAINQFLECKDLDSKKGRQLIEKISQSAEEFLEKILLTIIEASEPHREVLKAICCENVKGVSEAFFLDSLLHDDASFRLAAAEILSEVEPLQSTRLFSRLKPGRASNAEIIDLLGAQVKTLKPEDIINAAVRLGDIDGVQLLKLAEASEIALDFENLRFQPEKIKDPTFKASLVRYLGSVSQSAVVELLTRFLTGSSKMVGLEALSSLNRLNFRFDAAIILPFIANMNNVEQKLALEIIDKQADAALIPKLPPYLSSKSKLINYMLYKIIAAHATRDNLEKFFLQLEKQESWVREQVVNHLQVLEDDKLVKVGRALCAHDDEFIRNSAQKITGYQLDSDDLEKIGEFALNENWQVRQRAIKTLGKSSNRQALSYLKKVLEQWPDTAISVIEAVKLLGFSEGLAIAFECLGNAEASVQRAALDTIAAITKEEDADGALENIVSSLPRLNQELKMPANNIIAALSNKFGLSTAVIDSALSRAERSRSKAGLSAYVPGFEARFKLDGPVPGQKGNRPGLDGAGGAGRGRNDRRIVDTQVYASRINHR